MSTRRNPLTLALATLAGLLIAASLGVRSGTA